MFSHMILLGPIFAQLQEITKSASDRNMPVILLQTVVISMVTLYLIWRTHENTTQPRSLKQTASIGASIGLLIYGIHEMSNYATVIGWTSDVMIWHTLVGVMQMAVVAIWMRWVKEKMA